MPTKKTRRVKTDKEKVLDEQHFNAVAAGIKPDVRTVIVTVLEEAAEKQSAGLSLNDIADDFANRLAFDHYGHKYGVGGKKDYLNDLRHFWYQARFAILLEAWDQTTLELPTAQPK